MPLNLKLLSTALCAAVLTGVLAAPASADVVTLRLDDHPDGEIQNPSYVLRLDGLFGDLTGFTVGESDLDFVDLTIDEDAGTMQMTGTIYGGEIFLDGQCFVEADYYDVEMSWTGLVGVDDGWFVEGADATGTLRQADGTLVADLAAKADDNGESMLVRDMNFRNDVAGDGVFTVWGWVMFSNAFNGATTNTDGYQDWLAVAAVPEPAGLLGLGVLGLGLLRRRSA